MYNKQEYNRQYHKDHYKRKGYNQKGANNNAYKTGKGYYKTLIKESCEFCGDTKNLCVHHIDENRDNNIIENLATLCRSCHVLIHAFLRDEEGRFIKKGDM